MITLGFMTFVLLHAVYILTAALHINMLGVKTNTWECHNSTKHSRPPFEN